MVVVGELGPDSGVTFMPDLNEILRGRSTNSALYVACRVSYTSNERSYTGSDFCFRYVQELSGFTLCTRPEGKQTHK